MNLLNNFSIDVNDIISKIRVKCTMSFTKAIVYFLSIVIFIVVVSMIIFKIRHPFWSKMYAYHPYSFSNWKAPFGVIRKTSFERNRYYDPYKVDCNLLNIHDENPENIKEQLNELADIVKTNYMNKKDVRYEPSTEHILAMVTNLEFPIFVSFYREPQMTLSHIQQPSLSMQKVTTGVMMFRPLHIRIWSTNTKSHKHYIAYYVDFLCVKKSHQRQGIGPKIIYTSWSNARDELYKRYRRSPDECAIHNEKDQWLEERCIGDIYFSKHENYPLPLVSFCEIPTSIWDIRKIKSVLTNHNLHPVECINITEKEDHLLLLMDVFTMIKEHKKNSILTTMENAREQIRAGLLYIYVLKFKQDIFAVYVLKDSHTTYRENYSVECVSSFLHPNYVKDVRLFQDVFLMILKDLSRSKKIGYAIIENIGDGCFLSMIQNKFVKKVGGFIQYYYLFNYKQETIHKRDLFTLY